MFKNLNWLWLGITLAAVSSGFGQMIGPSPDEVGLSPEQQHWIEMRKADWSEPELLAWSRFFNPEIQDRLILYSWYWEVLEQGLPFDPHFHIQVPPGYPPVSDPYVSKEKYLAIHFPKWSPQTQQAWSELNPDFRKSLEESMWRSSVVTSQIDIIADWWTSNCKRYGKANGIETSAKLIPKFMLSNIDIDWMKTIGVDDLNIGDYEPPQTTPPPIGAQQPSAEPSKQAGDKSQSFWTTLPGILTALAGLITAIAGLFKAFGRTRRQAPAPHYSKKHPPGTP